VGLAKACKRHGIPRPPRGYWAKLEAGKRVDKPKLPNPDKDNEVDLAGIAPEVKKRQETERKKEQAWLQEHAPSEPKAAEPTKMVESLEDAHALVKATARLVDRIPAMEKRWERRRAGEPINWNSEDRPPHVEHGRRHLFRQGCLNIRADLSNIDWILRFHASLIAALERAGFKIAWREAEPSRNSRNEKPAAVTVTRKSECFELRFSEGYRRVPLNAAEVAAFKKRNGYEPYRNHDTVPSGKYTIEFSGAEYRAQKSWQATADALERRLDEIVSTVDELATLQPMFRKEREDAAARAQLAAERREQVRRIAESRSDQVKRAFAMAEAQEKADRLRLFLDSLEARGVEYRDPYRERVWLRVVREEVQKSDRVEAMLLESLSVPSWQSWPPPWWPEGLPTAPHEVDAKSE
jgi:hypothetical protein